MPRDVLHRSCSLPPSACKRCEKRCTSVVLLVAATGPFYPKRLGAMAKWLTTQHHWRGGGGGAWGIPIPPPPFDQPTPHIPPPQVELCMIVALYWDECTGLQICMCMRAGPWCSLPLRDDGDVSETSHQGARHWRGMTRASPSGSESRALVDCSVAGRVRVGASPEQWSTAVLLSAPAGLLCMCECECVIQCSITIALSAPCLSERQHFCSSDEDAGD